MANEITVKVFYSVANILNEIGVDDKLSCFLLDTDFDYQRNQSNFDIYIVDEDYDKVILNNIQSISKYNLNFITISVQEDISFFTILSNLIGLSSGPFENRSLSVLTFKNRLVSLLLEISKRQQLISNEFKNNILKVLSTIDKMGDDDKIDITLLLAEDYDESFRPRLMNSNNIAFEKQDINNLVRLLE